MPCARTSLVARRTHHRQGQTRFRRLVLGWRHTWFLCCLVFRYIVCVCVCTETKDTIILLRLRKMVTQEFYPKTFVPVLRASAAAAISPPHVDPGVHCTQVLPLDAKPSVNPVGKKERKKKALRPDRFLENVYCTQPLVCVRRTYAYVWYIVYSLCSVGCTWYPKRTVPVGTLYVIILRAVVGCILLRNGMPGFLVEKFEWICRTS